MIETDPTLTKLATLPMAERLVTAIKDVTFSVRTDNCLRSENITTLGELCRLSEYELLRVPNFGRRSLDEIRETLQHLHLPPLRKNIDDPPPKFDLPLIMARLRHMVDSYETVPFASDADLTACLRVTYWDRASNSGITLVVGVEPATRDDDDT